MSSDTAHGTTTDVRFVAVGVGLDIRWQCFGCGQKRPTLGSKGAGVFRRCGVCVVARDERKGAAA